MQTTQQDLKAAADLLGMPEIAAPTEDVDLKAPLASDTTPLTETTLDALRQDLEKVDPQSIGYIDEEVAQLMSAKRRKEMGLQEGELTAGELFQKLTPKQKAELLATYHVRTLHGVGSNHPMWLDKKAIPANLVCHWMSPKIVAALGPRGYTRVPHTSITQRWAPNARQMGASKWITHANYVLCAIDADVYLESQIRAYRMTNRVLEETDERFVSALRSAAGQAGIRAKDAAQLDREGRGAYATRGFDPQAAQTFREKGELRQDLVRGDGEK